MKHLMRLALIALVAAVVSGCSLVHVNTGPNSLKEAFPNFTPAPNQVLAIFEGEASFVATFYDEATGQAVGEWFESGALPYVSYNGQPPVRISVRTLTPGRYRVVVKPFYYESRLLPPRRYRVDLYEQSAYVSLHPGKQPVYESTYTNHYWADVIRIDTGRIPKWRLPLPNIDIQGTGIMADMLEQSRRRVAR